METKRITSGFPDKTMRSLQFFCPDTQSQSSHPCGLGEYRFGSQWVGEEFFRSLHSEAGTFITSIFYITHSLYMLQSFSLDSILKPLAQGALPLGVLNWTASDMGPMPFEFRAWILK